ncbi:hypothetical protein [Endozoicomonas elysicola]|uniref:Uncharacterized protein n=1 Tax=Endozoicomonas elysicola TaxID=305900 RepID=A0A081KBP2_9GAMM|nr:hypothetical protein [Endozoicomonas elysicola]KEI71568.1 hypothetical protein GV64_13205 [Endozoicomonas elysicola]
MNTGNLRSMVLQNQVDLAYGQVMTKEGQYILLGSNNKVRIVNPELLLANNLDCSNEIKRAYDFAVSIRRNEVRPMLDGDSSAALQQPDQEEVRKLLLKRVSGPGELDAFMAKCRLIDAPFLVGASSSSNRPSTASPAISDKAMRDARKWAEHERKEERFEGEARVAFLAHMHRPKGRTLGDVSDISKPLGIVIPQSFSTDVKHIKVYNDAGQPDSERTGEVRYILSDLIKHGFLRVVAGAELKYTEQTDPILLEEFADSHQGEVVAYRRQEAGKVVEEYVKADDLVKALTIPTEVVSYGRKRYLFRSIVSRGIVFCAETFKGKAMPGVSAVPYQGDFLATIAPGV